LLGLNHDVIDVNLEVTPDLLMEASLHATLICHVGVLQPKRHLDVAVAAKQGDEHRRQLLGLAERDLVVSRVGIQES
jgi:hypothetical protein